jgi:O-antigen/teichoic acid export membrane protein
VAEARRALRDSVYALFARGLRATTRIVGLALIARYQTVSELADFAYAYSVATLLGLTADCGASEYASREIATHGDDKELVRRLVTLRIATMPVTFGLAFVITYATGGISSEMIAGGVGFALALALADTLAAVHRGLSNHRNEALEYALPTSAVAIAWIAVKAGVALVPTLAITAGGMVLVRATRMATARGTRTSSVGYRELLVVGRWLGARALVTTALFEAPILLLEQLSTKSEVGIYAIAARPVGLVTQATTVLGFVFIPILSRSFARDRSLFDEQARALNLIALYATPGAFAACVLGGNALLHASGEAYVIGQSVVALLAVGTLVYVTTLTTAPLIAARHDRATFAAGLLGLVVLVATSVVLVPRYGAFGAAAASMIAFAATKILHGITYAKLGLSLGDRLHVIAYAMVIAFLAGVSLLDGLPRLALLGAGACASLAVTARMLAATRVSAS